MISLEERQEMITVLELVSLYSYEYLKSLNDEKLVELYKEKQGK
ncbi:hypothetical protein NSQ59_27780 [Margalitia sp. FSL K6-0131]